MRKPGRGGARPGAGRPRRSEAQAALLDGTPQPRTGKGRKVAGVPRAQRPAIVVEVRRDYVALADAWAKAAVADQAQAVNCRWARLAAQRYQKDRQRARQPGAPFSFDAAKANEACAFIETLPHVEGRWATPTIELHPVHVFLLVQLFGFRKPDGTRRFTSVLLSTARKNAKSTLAAAVLLYCLCGEDEVGPQLITAATTGSQARVVFNITKAMVDKSGALRKRYNLDTRANAIVSWNAWGNIRPINAKASTQDGLNPSHVVLDEIHAHRSHDLLNVLQSAAGARANPLWVYTTTEGYESPGPWPEMRQYARNLLNGILADEDTDHFLVLVFALDEEQGDAGQANYRPADDDFDEAKWVKANPLVTVNPVLAAELRKAAADAKQMPGRHAEFKIKRLNRPSAAAQAWLRVPEWKRCGGPVDLAEVLTWECCAAIDGAATTDLFALRFAWRKGKVVVTWGTRWCPAEAVLRRAERGMVPYQGWVTAGLIRVLPGRVLDYAVIERDASELFDRFKPKVVAYDPWGIQDLVNRLAQKYPMQEFRQGARSYHPAMRETERLYLAGDLRHGDDPVLNWCASNVVPRFDENMNMSPDRRRSADKIDDACALFMAVGTLTAGAAAAAPRKEFQLVFV